MSRGLAWRCVGYFAVREFIPLYGVYSLVFQDSGLSTGQISSLLIIWSLTSFAAEIPSGAWADSVPRRRLLIASSLLFAAAFTLWTSLPSYPGFAAGFVLWGISGALMSGTFEALLYDELAANSATERYPHLMGWANALAMLATLAGTMLATPLYEVGGYRLVGWVSVAVALLQGFLAWTLPVAPQLPADDDDLSTPGGTGFVRRYQAMLAAGLAEVIGERRVRHGVLVVSLLLGFLAYDEYFPLVAREDGADTATVPLLVALTVLGEVVGTALVGRTAAVRGSTMAWALVVSAAFIAVGVSIGQWTGFAAIGVGYGMAHNAIIVSEARLQNAISGPARATVTSVSGLLSEGFAVAMFGLFALGSSWLSVSSILVAMTLPLVAVAAIVPRWLPKNTSAPDD